jgi:hypothetical protein
MKAICVLLSMLVTLVITSALAAAEPSGIPKEALTADDYIEFWKPLVGSWKSTTEINGKTTSGTFRFRLARNQKCLLLYSEDEGGQSVQQIQGYDPATKRSVAWGFTHDGSVWFQAIVIEGMKKGMKAAAGVGGTWEKRISSRDGKTVTQTAKWVFPQVDDKRLAILWSDLKEDGKPISDVKFTLER